MPAASKVIPNIELEPLEGIDEAELLALDKKQLFEKLRNFYKGKVVQNQEQKHLIHIVNLGLHHSVIIRHKPIMREHLFHLSKLIKHAVRVSHEPDKKNNADYVDTYKIRYKSHGQQYQASITIKAYPHDTHNFYHYKLEDIDIKRDTGIMGAHKNVTIASMSLPQEYPKNPELSTKIEKSQSATPKRAAITQCKYKGLPISIEQRKGGVRYWYDPLEDRDGRTKFRYPYGYIRGTEGEDGDHVDVFLGPNEKSDYVFIAEQVNPNTGLYDEDKVMLGFNSLPEAESAYLAHYDNPNFLGDIRYMNFAEFVKSLPKHGEGRKIYQNLSENQAEQKPTPKVPERIAKSQAAYLASKKPEWQRKIESIQKSLDKSKLIQKHITVTRKGKTFQTTVWVKSSFPVIKLPELPEHLRSENLTLQEFSEKLFSKFRNKRFKNKDTGAIILVPKRGIKHSLHNIFAGDPNITRASLYHLDQLLEGAKHLKTKPDKRQDPLVLKVDTYLIGGLIQDAKYQIKLVVKVRKDTGDVFYDHLIIKNGAGLKVAISKSFIRSSFPLPHSLKVYSPDSELSSEIAKSLNPSQKLARLKRVIKSQSVQSIDAEVENHKYPSLTFSLEELAEAVRNMPRVLPPPQNPSETPSERWSYCESALAVGQESGIMPLCPMNPKWLPWKDRRKQQIQKSYDLKAGERWITIHSNGQDSKGQPLLIKENKDGSASVLAGAGGKLNGLRLQKTKNKEEYNQHIKEKRESIKKKKAEEKAAEAGATFRKAALKTHSKLKAGGGRIKKRVPSTGPCRCGIATSSQAWNSGARGLSEEGTS